jgi:4-hydroxy-tetrahydrodipicolinate reductase
MHFNISCIHIWPLKNPMIKIAVTGASGRMGQTLIEAIEQTDGVVLGVELDKGDDLSAVLDQFEVLIDFTRPEATLDYLAICLSANKAMVGMISKMTSFANLVIL